MESRRPCPCCGHLVFDAEDGGPGSYGTCPVCFWEDDPEQLRRPLEPGGVHGISLAEAQRNFRVLGACVDGLRRVAASGEMVDPTWRPIDPEEWADEEAEPTAERQVVVDVGAVRSERELHEVLKRELGFPAFYGMNWDAFWDAVTGLVVMPRELAFVGWGELERRVPQGAGALRRQLTRYQEQAMGRRVQVTYGA